MELEFPGLQYAADPFAAHNLDDCKLLPTGAVTFLFSDIEGSTRLLTALGTDRDEIALESRIKGAVDRTSTAHQSL